MNEISPSTINKNLKGSTILEVLIACTLICISVTMFAMTYASCQKSNGGLSRLKAVELAENAMYESLEDKSVSDHTSNIDQYIVEKKILKDLPFDGCYTILITIYDDQRKARLFTLEGKLPIKKMQ